MLNFAYVFRALTFKLKHLEGCKYLYIFGAGLTKTRFVRKWGVFALLSWFHDNGWAPAIPPEAEPVANNLKFPESQSSSVPTGERERGKKLKSGTILPREPWTGWR